MTDRLYYTDATVTAFTATVVSTGDDGRHVVLDRTAFYPTSGGQPHDTGTLGGRAVVDVIDDGDRIVHVLDAPLTATGTVQGQVDWARRFDHMQQHTGQHLLSAVFEEMGWSTVSVAFGADSASVELTTNAVGPEALARAERTANARITENRPVTVSFEDAAAANARLRKPSDRTGTLRLVTIADLDVSACGGTHVRHTGEIGALLLGGTERVRDHVRVSFWCGGRAVARARRDREALAALAGPLGTSADELATLVPAQAAQLKALEKERTKLVERLAAHEALARWHATAPRADGVRVIVERQPAADADAVRALAQAAASLERALVIGVAGGTIALGASRDSGCNAGALLKPLLSQHGGRGGGGPQFAQGTAPEGALEAIVAALAGA
jgi:alanyl-tRNA synthetase